MQKFLLYIIKLLIIITPLMVHAQIGTAEATNNETSIDTLLADTFYTNAKNFADSSQFDSSIFYYKKQDA